MSQKSLDGWLKRDVDSCASKTVLLPYHPAQLFRSQLFRDSALQGSLECAKYDGWKIFCPGSKLWKKFSCFRVDFLVQISRNAHGEATVLMSSKYGENPNNVVTSFVNFSNIYISILLRDKKNDRRSKYCSFQKKTVLANCIRTKKTKFRSQVSKDAAYVIIDNLPWLISLTLKKSWPIFVQNESVSQMSLLESGSFCFLKTYLKMQFHYALLYTVFFLEVALLPIHPNHPQYAQP